MFSDNTMTLGDYLEIATPVPGKESDLLVTNDCIGIEVELEAAGRLIDDGAMRASPHWAMVRDGSLRGTSVELVYKRPQSGVDIIDSLVQLEDRCNATQPEATVRTSVHVHLNCTDLTPGQLCQMISLYSVFEKVLFRTYASHRYGNHFCTPFTHCAEFTEVARWLHSGWAKFEKMGNSSAIGRYCAFNIKSLFKFGTIEYRHLGGTWSKEFLLSWINVIQSLKRASLTPIDFRDRFFMNSADGFIPALQEFLPREAVSMIRAAYGHNDADINSDIIEGIQFVQNLFAPRVKI